jgi:hypothetical protein
MRKVYPLVIQLIVTILLLIGFGFYAFDRKVLGSVDTKTIKEHFVKGAESEASWYYWTFTYTDNEGNVKKVTDDETVWHFNKESSQITHLYEGVFIEDLDDFRILMFVVACIAFVIYTTWLLCNLKCYLEHSICYNADACRRRANFYDKCEISQAQIDKAHQCVACALNTACNKFKGFWGYEQEQENIVQQEND